MENSFGTTSNESGWPAALWSMRGGPTVGVPGMTAYCSARHELPGSSGTAVQSPDLMVALRRPSPCSLTSGPKVNHRSLTGYGVATGCHCAPAPACSAHTKGAFASGGNVVAPTKSETHAVPGCGTTGSAAE